MLFDPRLPFDPTIPMSGLFELAGKWLLELDLIDLVFMYPHLSWLELGQSAGAVLGFKLLADQLDRLAFRAVAASPITRRARSRVADGLDRLAAWVRPA